MAGGRGTSSAIGKILSKFKLKDHASFFVAVNGPAWVIDSLITKLRQETDLKVSLDSEGLHLQLGMVYIEPVDRHMIINPEKQRIIIKDTPSENFLRLSADPMFKIMDTKN